VGQTNDRAASSLRNLRTLAALVVVAVAGVSCGSVDDPRNATVSEALESPPWEEIPDPDPTPTAPVGRVEGKPGVDAHGQFTYDIPLWVPEGRADMAPNLGLSYNSGSANGFLGVGWTLTGESFLHRCGKTVARDGEADNVDFDEGDNFCLDGTKLIEVGRDDFPGIIEPPNGDGILAEYRLERNTNARVLAFGKNKGYPSGWVVLTEDGRINYYESAVGANRHPTLEHVDLGWMRDRISDRRGNEIHYIYHDPYFQAPTTRTGLRLDKIEYTLSSSGPYAGSATREVRFNYDGERPDPLSTWVSGIEVFRPVRISSIEMWAPPPNGGPLELARQYDLGYEESQRTHRSLLESVQLCDGQGACVPKTNLRYAAPPENVTKEVEFNQTTLLLSTTENPPNVFSFAGLPNILPLDADGDGFDDVLYTDVQYSQYLSSYHAAPRPRIMFSTGAPPVNLFQLPSVVQDWSSGTAWEMLGPSQGVFDHDQDGRADWFSLERYADPQQLTTHRVLRELGSTYGQLDDTSSWTSSHDNCNDFPAECWFNALDLDGDGLTDIVNPKYYAPAPVGYKWRYLKNDPEAAQGRFTEQPIPFNELKLDNSQQTLIGDLDGDGAHDFLEYDDSGQYRRMWLEDGKVQTSDHAQPDMRDSSLADINGDGLPDLVTVAPIKNIEVGENGILYHFGVPTVYLNTGNGFAKDPIYLGSLQLPPAHAKPRPIVADFNGDGRDDVLVLTSTLEEYGVPLVPMEDRSFFLGKSPDQLWISRGTSFESISPNYLGKFPYLNAYEQPQFGTATPNQGHMPLALGDFDNDGNVDVIALSTNSFTTSCDPNGDHYGCLLDLSFEIYLQDLGDEPYHDRLVEVVDGFGRRDTIVYDKHSPHGKVDTDPTYIYDGTPCEYPVKCTKRGNPLVRSHTVSDDKDPTTERIWTYRYEGHRSDLQGRGSLGFSTVTKIDSATGAVEETTYHQDVYGSQWPFGKVRAYPRVGMIESRSTTYPMGTDPVVEVREEYNYDTQWDLYAPWYRVVTTGKTVTTYEGSVVAHTRTTSYQDFERGHPKTIVEATEGGFQEITTRVFENDPYRWLIAKVAYEQVTSITPAPELESETRAYKFEYVDETGQIEEIERQYGVWFDADTYLHTTFDYDGGGLLSSVTREDSGALPPRVEFFGYSPDGVYVTQFVNAENHHLHWAFDPAHDQVVIAADENDAITELFYDGLGRETKEIAPDGGVMVTDYVSSGAGSMAVERTSLAGGWESAHVDAFARPVKHEALLGTGATKTMVRTRYDAAGRTWKRSVPTISGASVGDGWESYVYDSMGRPKRIVRPGPAPYRQVSWQYPDLFTVVETNEVGNQITRVFSPDRMPVSASVQVGSETEVTAFGYAPFGDIDRIEDPAGNVTSMKFDPLGRRTLLDDPNTGEVHEAYNAFGELREQVDAIGNLRTFAYDRLGRMLTRSTEDGTDLYVYDVGTGILGRPHMSHSADGVTIAYHHDSIGRPVGRTYTMGFEQFSLPTSTTSTVGLSRRPTLLRRVDFSSLRSEATIRPRGGLRRSRTRAVGRSGKSRTVTFLGVRADPTLGRSSPWSPRIFRKSSCWAGGG